MLFDYTITDTNLHIRESHSVGKFQMMQVLRQAKQSMPQSSVWKRCMASLYLEWICHNFLYMIRYKRSRTRDCDLDNPCDHPEWMYVVGGIAAWLVTFKTK